MQEDVVPWTLLSALVPVRPVGLSALLGPEEHSRFVSSVNAHVVACCQTIVGAQ